MRDKFGFDRFTERARRVVVFASQEAAKRGQGEIYPEHLFLGLLIEGDGIAGKVLKKLGVRRLGSSRLLTSIVPKRKRINVKNVRQISGATRGIYHLSTEEANSLGHHYIGTEHLLLALCKYDQGVLGLMLERLKVNYVTVYEMVDEILYHSLPRSRSSTS